MAKVIITADSTCDLNKAQAEEYGILISPLYVRTDDGEFLDGVDIDAKTLFETVERTGNLPKTAACSVNDYIKLWQPLVEAGNEVVHINISSEFSSCFQNANLAASELNGVFVIDSRNLSTGTGLLAIEGACLAREGKSGKEIAELLSEKVGHLNVSFVLDTMDYLAKGGRCSAVAAFAAGLLKLKLCIEVKDGKMDVSKKYRGKLLPVFKQYIHERLQAAGDVELKRIFITSTFPNDEYIDELKQAVLAEKPFEEILISNAGCTISSHCGPNTCGILFFEAKK